MKTLNTRSSTLLLALAAAMLVAGCKSKTSTETQPAAATDAPIQACEDFFTKVKVCIENTSGRARKAYELSQRQFREQVDEATDAAAKKNAGKNCAAALQALQRNPACMDTPTAE
jgi:hypothetical protein